jgi:hypothetical protein
VRYVRQILGIGSGLPLAVRGGARLQITIRGPASGNLLGDEVAQVTGFQTFRQVRGAGSFENVTVLGLGVRSRLPFRVFRLPDPSRLIVDVAH